MFNKNDLAMFLEQAASAPAHGDTVEDIGGPDGVRIARTHRQLMDHNPSYKALFDEYAALQEPVERKMQDIAQGSSLMVSFFVRAAAFELSHRLSAQGRELAQKRMALASYYQDQDIPPEARCN